MINPIQLTPGMDQATMVAAINDVFRQVESENRSKTVRDEDGVDRIIFGRYPDGKYGLKVSKPGKDVNSTDENDFIFDSNNNLFKIEEEGETTLTLPVIASPGDGSTFSVVPHSVGYEPLVLAFAIRSSGGNKDIHVFGQSIIQAAPVVGPNVDIKFLNAERVTATSSTIRFDWEIANATGFADPGGNLLVKYYLLTETAS